MMADEKALEKRIDDLFAVVTEGFDAFRQGFEQVDKRFAQVDKRFEQIDKRFEQVDKRFEQVDKRFEQVDKRFEQVDKRFEQLDVRVGSVETAQVKTKVELQTLIEAVDSKVGLVLEKVGHLMERDDANTQAHGRCGQRLENHDLRLLALETGAGRRRKR